MGNRLPMFAPDQRFNAACDRFTQACVNASHWKLHYFGAAYTTRVAEAIAELESAIAVAKREILGHGQR